MRAMSIGRQHAIDSCPKTYSKVVREYLAWGKAQGGKRGMPWCKHLAIHRKRMLGWWQQQLHARRLGDLDDCLPKVEEALRQLGSRGLAGKTLHSYGQALKTFCNWCLKRKYLVENPLRELAPFDCTPRTIRRALTIEEIRRLLEAAPEHRRLLYEVAFTTGLRAGELRALSVHHLDVEHSCLRLDAAWTKNRRSGFQPLPAGLTERLARFARKRLARKYYREFPRGRGWKAIPPRQPLLYVQLHTDRAIVLDLKHAGIPVKTAEGKVDFHACRVAYINLVLDSGASVKEAQVLARHSTPVMTMNVYGRTRDCRLTELAEKVGAKVFGSLEGRANQKEQELGSEEAQAKEPRGRGQVAEACLQQLPKEGIPAALRHLSSLPSDTFLGEQDLALFFGKSVEIIRQAGTCGDLPHPLIVLGQPVWSAGMIVEHVRRRASAADDACDLA